MKPNTLVERLRGIVRIPVNDGAGLLDGKDFFERSFPTSPLAREAADEIERLTDAQQWQDISTAPKDGTCVLVTDHRDPTRTWVAGYNATMSRHGPVWKIAPDGYVLSVTHWQPLPTPPVTRHNGGGE